MYLPEFIKYTFLYLSIKWYVFIIGKYCQNNKLQFAITL